MRLNTAAPSATIERLFPIMLIVMLFCLSRICALTIGVLYAAIGVMHQARRRLPFCQRPA